MVVENLWQLDFTPSQNYPEISIVIPGFGAHEMTADCLVWLERSLKLNETSCEVILVDDASDVPYADFFSEVRGLRIIRNAINLGFLDSCNRAAQLGRGKNLLLLNNDTLPVGRWVDLMAARLANTPGALVVGARLVGLDGKLQESGGIVFSDGSGWNFGRNWDACDPRSSYAREVDYCSGAAILIQGEFMRQIGLFDRRYAPAYYEDTDICFEARRCGGSVWVEPKAVVIHREGASHGNDLSGGVKKMQAVNRGVFTEKWKDTLPDQFPAEPNFVWKARTRGAKKRILIIDEEVPRFDAQSGALRMFSILRLIRKLDYEVTFLPSNGLRTQPYTDDLEELGVEVLGPHQHFWNYVKESGDSIVAVWVSRVTVMNKFYSTIRSDLPNTPIIFDTVDLHHIRERREATIKGQSSASDSSSPNEIKFFRLADMVVVVSDVEASIVKGFTSQPVFTVSNIHEICDPVLFPPKNAQGVFVGSFRHSPNEDGIRWFIDNVLPLVIREEPAFKLHIVGERPPEWLVGRQGEHITVHGWVDDVVAVIREVRLSVAPLRFGAGVKGKISQSLSIGTPVVTTQIGAEGMNLRHGIDAFVCDHPSAFAESIIKLIRDDHTWRLLSTNGLASAKSNYGTEQSRNQLMSVLSVC